jgi:cytochrome c2
MDKPVLAPSPLKETCKGLDVMAWAITTTKFSKDNLIRIGFAASIAMFSVSPVLAQSAERGEKIFKACRACHQVGDTARNRTGPVLNGVIGRQAGTFAGYRYSKSMAEAGRSGLVWDETAITEYLISPTAYIRRYLDNPKAKVKMAFRLNNADDRRDVAAYLAGISAPDQTSAPEIKTNVKPGALAAGPGKICVQNASAHSYLFASEGDDGTRLLQTLAPQDTLCTTASATGIVSVFESDDALEGCSRVVAAGTTEQLLKYADFDRCAWSSNS